MNTEHSGGKNGGGYWGKREEAKNLSDKARRSAGDRYIEAELALRDLRGESDWDLESQYEDRYGGE